MTPQRSWLRSPSATPRRCLAAKAAVERLIQTIVSIVKDEMLPKGGYVNPNVAHLALGTYSPTCKPVTVYRTA